ncbi:MAG: universal stress protein [Planctomycetales bacterium]|nr:universal stress protein [Planctomycetales bacterium]
MDASFTHILLPLDFSQQNQQAIDHAIRVAEPTAARITLLHVIETVDCAETNELRDFYNGLETQAETRLAEFRTRFPEDRLDVQSQIVFGRRGPEIVRFVADHHVDLIILGAGDPASQQPAARLGTLSYQVALMCNCSVLLVK